MVSKVAPIPPPTISPTPPTTTNKVESFVDLGRWFDIVGRLFSAAATVVGGLPLIGRSFCIESFSACCIGAFVCHLLSLIYNNSQSPNCNNSNAWIQCGAPPEMAGMFQQALGEGSSFEFAGQNYYIARTLGDGACGAHAVLGTKGTGWDTQYRYREGDVRKFYVERMEQKMSEPDFKDKWEQWMINLLQDYKVSGGVSGGIFRADLVQNLEQDLQVVASKKKGVQQEQIRLLSIAWENQECQNIIKSILMREIQQDGRRQGLKLDEQCVENQLNVDEEYRFTKMRGCLDDIIESLVQFKIACSLADILVLRNHIDDEQTECYRTCIQSEGVRAAYKEAVLRSTYHFSTQELSLMAWAFDRHVKVFHQGRDGIVMDIDEGNPDHPSVEVFHNEEHFSRCERVSE